MTNFLFWVAVVEIALFSYTAIYFIITSAGER